MRATYLGPDWASDFVWVAGARFLQRDVTYLGDLPEADVDEEDA